MQVPSWMIVEEVAEDEAQRDCLSDPYDIETSSLRRAASDEGNQDDPTLASESIALPKYGEKPSCERLPRSLGFVRRANIRKHFSGWQRGVAIAAATTSVLFSINFTVMILAWTRRSIGIGTLYDGACANHRQLNIGFHLVINTLSTILLGASSYTMQVLSAPTRAEVDRAHRSCDWLDIGVPSVRNLTRISRRRRVLWWLLALSSGLLHLMYNSAIYTTTVANEYLMVVATEDFITTVDITFPWFWLNPPHGHDLAIALAMTKQRMSTYQNLSNEDCITAYAGPYVSDRRDVILVYDGDNTSVNHTVLCADFFSVQFSTNWACPNGKHQPYNLTQSLQDPGHIAVYPVKYCLSEQVSESCRYEFSLQFLVVVVVCNLVKLVCMAITIWRPKDPPLVTIGDAVVSFMSSPDPITIGKCMTSRDDLVKSGWDIYNRYMPKQVMHFDFLAEKWDNRPRYWGRAVSGKRWTLCIFLWTFLLVALSALLITIQNGSSFTSLWNSGFGEINSSFLVSTGTFGFGSVGLTLNLLVANLPQVVVSFMYFLYNGIFTGMLLGYEWSNYAHEHKGLRVTHPIGKQRSTYWLQLPYTYSVPLLVLSALMHWLVSQSFFLARVIMRRSSEDSYSMPGPESAVISTCGYSPIAIMFAIALGILIVIGILANAFRAYKPGIPLVSSVSVAISAACHPPAGDNNAGKLPVRWGEIEFMRQGGVGHCSLTCAEDVSMPVVGRLYT